MLFLAGADPTLSPSPPSQHSLAPRSNSLPHSKIQKLHAYIQKTGSGIFQNRYIGAFNQRTHMCFPYPALLPTSKSNGYRRLAHGLDHFVLTAPIAQEDAGSASQSQATRWVRKGAKPPLCVSTHSAIFEPKIPYTSIMPTQSLSVTRCN